ncbi:hypothetical protein GCM10029964_026110 [Kibdelosporangium lantanae]
MQKEDSSIFLNPDLGVVAKALNELRDNVYPAWEKTLTQARDGATRAGVGPWQIPLVPGKGFFGDMYQGHFGKRLYTNSFSRVARKADSTCAISGRGGRFPARDRRSSRSFRR